MSVTPAADTPLSREDLAAPLREMWYFAGSSRDIKPGKMERRFFLDEPVVLGRTQAGVAFALHDVCPHRAAPLSAGRQTDHNGRTCVECPYHGWRFAIDDGACQSIPALSEKDDTDPTKIRTLKLPLHEAQGLLWIYIPTDLRRFDGVPKLPPPALPTEVTGKAPKMVITAPAEGPYDEAVIGLVDPAHTPYVHQQWFWRRPDGAAEKTKNYEPCEFGFRMKAHQPASNGRAYRILGGAVTTQIEFRLPAIRSELIRNDRYTILGLTAITPTKAGHSIITQNFFWDMPLLSAIRPFAYPLARQFLGQDGLILRRQNENLQLGRQPTLYVGDPDRLAQWYLALKRAYRKGGAAEFENPVPETTLHWRT